MVSIRAVYEDGYLKPLEPLDLTPGQEVRVTIEGDERDKLRAVLGDLVRWANPDDDRDAWVEDEADAIDKAFQGDPPLSQIIIDDRGER